MADKIEFEEALIDLVRHHPCLYMKKDDGYRNRTTKEAAWTLIGERIDKSAEECRVMWKSLRQQYLAFLKKIDFPTGTGASSRPHFRHESSMAFCRETTGNTSSFTNVSMGEGSQSSDVIPTDQLPPGEVIYEVEAAEVANATPITAPGQTSTPRNHSKFQGKRKLDAVDEQLLKALKEDGNKKQDDEWDLFCGSLAHKLR